MRVLIAVAVFAGFAGTEGHTGQTHYEEVTLAQAVEWADAVVVVKPAAPSSRVAEHRIAAAPKEPFQYSVLRYVVEDVAHEAGTSKGKKPVLTPGATIEVVSADLATKLHVHTLYVAKGTHKSPVYARYEGASAAQSDDARRVVLIARTTLPDERAGWRFSVDGAVEPVGQLPLIMKLRQRETDAPPSPSEP